MIKPPRKYEEAIFTFGYFLDELNLEAILTDDLLNIEWLNRAARKKSGSIRKLIGKSWHYYIEKPPGHNADNCELCTSILDSGEAFSDVLQLEREGKEIFLQYFAFTLELPIWETQKFLMLLFDISDREKKQQATRAIHRLMNQALHDSGDAFFIVDSGAKIRSWNLGAELIFGYQEQAVIGKPLNLVIPGDSSDYITSEKFDTVNDKTRFIKKFETFANHRNGNKIGIDLTRSAVYDENGKIEGVSFIAKDITQRRHLRDKYKHIIQQFYRLNELTEHLFRCTDFQTLLNTVLLGITSTKFLNFDRAILCVITEESKYITGLYGMGPSTVKEEKRFKEMTEKEDLFDFMRNTNRDFLLQNDFAVEKIAKKIKVDKGEKSHILNRALLKRRTIYIRDGIHYDNGPQIEISGIEEISNILKNDTFAVIPLLGKDDAIGVLIVDNGLRKLSIPVEDLEILRFFISQTGLAAENTQLRQKAEAQLDELSIAYRQLQEQQDEMIKFQRLAALGEMSAKIAHEIRNPLVSMGGLAKVISNMSPKDSKSNEFANIIYNQALNLESMLENMLLLAGPTELNTSEQQLRTMVDEITLGMKMGKDCKNCEIINNLPPELVLHIDAYKIRQVITNLIRNAVQAMGKNGKIEISAKEYNDRTELHFRDHGPGIPEENRDKLFDPFFTTKQEGTGLGLTISRQIMQQHTGELLVKSVIGKGTDMVLLFPNTKTNN